MQAVILAAGRGNRLNPLTLSRSKAMLPILGRPMVQRVVEMLAAAGATNFVVVAHPEDQEMVRYFSKVQTDVQLVYQPERLGMADALERAAHLVRDDFFLSACDNLVPAEHLAEMLECWRGQPAPDAVLSLMRLPPEKLTSSGVVAWDGKWIEHIVEKPAPGEEPSDIASLPLYIFSPLVLEYLPEVKPSKRGERELQDAIEMLIRRRGRVRGALTLTRKTVTTAADLLALNLHFLAQGPELLHVECGNGTDVHLQPPVYIEEDVRLGAGSVIGPNVFIERGSVIGEKATLRDCMLLRGARVTEGTALSGQVVR